MNDSNGTQSFVVYLQTTHRHIHERVHQIENEWRKLAEAYPLRAQIDMQPGSKQLVQDLEQLRTDLARHFTEEDEEGCLEEAVCRCRSLSRDILEIKGEHSLLLAELDAILDALREHSQHARNLNHCLERGQEQFRHFARDLHAHEASENRVLEQAFGIPIE